MMKYLMMKIFYIDEQNRVVSNRYYSGKVKSEIKEKVVFSTKKRELAEKRMQDIKKQAKKKGYKVTHKVKDGVLIIDYRDMGELK